MTPRDQEIARQTYERQLRERAAAAMLIEAPEGGRLGPFKKHGDLAVCTPDDLWLVEGLLPRRGVAVLGGIPKSRKSWLALDLGVAVASGQPVFGSRNVARGPVLYLPMEDDEGSVRARLTALGAGRGIDASTLTALPLWIRPTARMDLLDPENLLDIVARAAQSMQTFRGFALIIIDPMRNAHRANEDSSMEMSEVFAALGRMQHPHGGLILVTHHLAKGQRAGGSMLDRFRGSTAIPGAVSAALLIDAVEIENPGKFTSTLKTVTRTGRQAERLGLTLEIHDERDLAVWARWTATATPENAARNAKAESLLEAIRVRGETAVSNLRDAGLGAATVKRLVPDLVAQGLVVVRRDGNREYVRLAEPMK